MESDPVQPVGFHEEGLRVELHRDAAGDHTCELPHQEDLLLGPAVQRGRTAPRIQALPAYSEAAVSGRAESGRALL